MAVAAQQAGYKHWGLLLVVVAADIEAADMAVALVEHSLVLQPAYLAIANTGALVAPGEMRRQVEWALVAEQVGYIVAVAVVVVDRA